MVSTLTPTYDFTQPEVGGDDDAWGTMLNGNWGKLDSLLTASFVGGSPSTLGQTFKITGAVPQLRFEETDMTDPLGRYRFQATGGEMRLERATTAAWAAVETLWDYAPATTAFTFHKRIIAPLRIGSLYVGGDPAGAASLLQLSALTGSALSLRGGIDTSGMIQFRNASTAATVAQIDAAGVAAIADTTVMTREKADARYLNLTGGTVTGDLTVGDSGKIKLNGTSPWLWLHDSDAVAADRNYMVAGNNGALRFLKVDDASVTTATLMTMDDTNVTTQPLTRLATASGSVEVGSSTSAVVKFMRSSSNNYIDMLAGTAFVFRSGVTPWASLQSVAGWTAGSDIKLKRNVAPIHYGLDTVLAMQPIQFDWIADGKHDIGFAAQDMLKLVPEIIDDLDDDNEERTTTLHMRKDALVVVLVRAVQELTARLEILEGGSRARA